MATNKLVFGVGINDAGYLTAELIRLNGRQICIWRCPFYARWADMLRRCYAESRKRRAPSYDGCTVEAAWHSFASFRSWMVEQPWQGASLDKDVLFAGNRVYGPDKCIFISEALNNFLTDRARARGEWPIGVSLAKRRGKFFAQCNNPFTGKNENLGYHATPVEAHLAWLRRKREHAHRYADLQSDPRIAKALRERFSG